MKYRTKDKTAKEGKDFLGGDFSLLFRHGEIEKRIIIPIIDDMSAKGKEEYFEVLFDFEVLIYLKLEFYLKIEIYDLSCEGALIGTKSSTIVTIANDELFNETLDNIMDLTQANLEDLKLYQSNWTEQIKVLFVLNIFVEREDKGGGKSRKASGIKKGPMPF